MNIPDMIKDAVTFPLATFNKVPKPFRSQYLPVRAVALLAPRDNCILEEKC